MDLVTFTEEILNGKCSVCTKKNMRNLSRVTIKMIPLITVSVRALIKTCSDKFLKTDKKALPIELLFLLKLQTYACDFSIKGNSSTILRSIYGRLPL